MNRPHWLTVDAVNDPERLEGLLAELKEKQPAEWKALFFEHMLERIKDNKRA